MGILRLHLTDSQQFLDESGGALARAVDRRCFRRKVGIGCQFSGEHCSIGVDDHEHVVEVVGNPTGDAADALQLLCLLRLRVMKLDLQRIQILISQIRSDPRESARRPCLVMGSLRHSYCQSQHQQGNLSPESGKFWIRESTG